jgi:hypothetical protein
LIGGDTGRSTLGPAEYPEAVINIKGSGALKIDGIVVTCGSNSLAWNKLVHVDVYGTLILYNGEISGNSIGDGVVNSGTFKMYGGRISNNTSIVGGGGSGVLCITVSAARSVCLAVKSPTTPDLE